MKLYKCCLVFLALFYFGNDTAWAQQCASKTTNIVFANGVGTKPKDAIKSRKKIRNLVKSQLESEDVRLNGEAINQNIPGAECKNISIGLQYNNCRGAC